MLPITDLAGRLGGELHGDRIRCPGPGHSPKDRSLSVHFKPDGSFSVCSFANDDWMTCRDHVKALCGMPQFESRHERSIAPPSKRNVRIETKSEQQKIARLWREALVPQGTLVETYLNRRGLILPDDVAMRTIRFHPACPWQNEHGIVIRAAVMLCRYAPIIGDTDPDAPPMALHRTRLRADGSGHLGKKMSGSPLGKVIKLTPDELVTEGLFLTEGVETGLEAWKRGLRPIWATSTAGALRTFPVLPGIEHLSICADHDQAGLLAAQECGERWSGAGKEACIRFSSKLGNDLADEAWL
ncbi:MAG: toprim domain-containing protein [Phyllobacterium sp.]|uniref:DUF7146 domain-containing protein n=1 Tax=Phyllobacterium sp. TaxID=1871046 RepID=UPI0030F07BCC